MTSVIAIFFLHHFLLRETNFCTSKIEAAVPPWLIYPHTTIHGVIACNSLQVHPWEHQICLAVRCLRLHPYTNEREMDIPKEVIHNKGQKYVRAFQAREVALQAMNRLHNLPAVVHRKQNQLVQWGRPVTRHNFFTYHQGLIRLQEIMGQPRQRYWIRCTNFTHYCSSTVRN